MMEWGDKLIIVSIVGTLIVLLCIGIYRLYVPCESVGGLYMRCY